MSEETKKTEKAGLSEQELDKVAGGVAGNDGGCIPPIKRPPWPPTTGDPAPGTLL